MTPRTQQNAPPSQSAASSSPSSLPPRPPPPIPPALPIMVPLNVKARKQYPPQGIGRGHASLPPKPFVPGKPLPRETEAIVLTPGGDGAPQFSTSSKPKRSYSAVTSDNNMMRPMDPAVTNLTPQNRVSPSASNYSSHGPSNHPAVPKTITPPAEQAMHAKHGSYGHPQNVEQPVSSGHSTAVPAAPAREPKGFRQNPAPENSGPMHAASQEQAAQYANSNGKNEVPQYRQDFQPAPEYHRSTPQPHDFNNGFPPGGAFPHDMYHPLGPMNGGMPGMPGQVPHPPHLQGQHQQPPPQAFFHHGYTGTLTPPNSGTMFMPPPPPIMDSMFDQLSNAAGGTSSHTPSYNHYPYPPPPLPPHAQRHMPHPPQTFSPPPLPAPAGPNQHIGYDDRREQQMSVAIEDRQSRTPEVSQPCTSNNRALMQRISFIPDDQSSEGHEHNGRSNGYHVANELSPEDRASDRPMTPKILNKLMVTTPKPDCHDTYSMSSYVSDQFLSKKLADVSLVVNLVTGDSTHELGPFPAHSFVLGKSSKLCQLIEDALKKDRHTVGTHSTSSWADEMENDSLSPVRPASELATASILSSYSVSDRSTTIKFTAKGGFLTKEAFLLALKSLYLGHYSEIDAFLDADHPLHQNVSKDFWVMNAANQSETFSTMATVGPDTESSADYRPLEGVKTSPQIQMIERSIGLLTAGCLLGIDAIVQRAIDGIRNWGMRFEGAAYERLMKFLLEEAKDMEHDPAQSSELEGSMGMKLNFVDWILNEAINFFVQNLPGNGNFKPEFRAPPSKYLTRLPGFASPPPTGNSTPQALMSKKAIEAKMLRTAYSTVFFSIPFDILKNVLEHDYLAIKGKKQRFDLACSVLQERERRRRREIKALQERLGVDAAIAGEVDGLGQQMIGFDGLAHQLAGLGLSENQIDILFSEESAVTTFGHNDIGVELTKRRKGAPGGRLLWKVGKSTARLP